MKSMRVGRGGGLLLAGLAAVAALGAGWVRAETRTWTGAVSKDWTVTGNWNPADSAPQAGDTVLITITNNAPILASSTPALASLVISNATLTATNWTTAIQAATVTIRAGGVITCSGPFVNAPAMTNRVYMSCSNLTIDAGGKIDVSGKGYAGGIQNPNGPGFGPGGGNVGHPGGGGGHGGYGGYEGGNGHRWGGVMYDVPNAPLQPGSGGGGYSWDGSGGNGGGAVRIDAIDRVTVNGSILADGAATGNRVGSGSGGSVYITCRLFSGTTGLIRADGGSATGSGCGSGGGGRIAISNDVAAQAEEPASGVRFSASGGACTSVETSRGGIGSLYFTDARLMTDGLANVLNGRIESPLYITNSVLMITNRWLGFAAGVQAVVTGDVLVSGTANKLEIGGYVLQTIALTPFRFDQAGGSSIKVGGNLVLTNSAQLRVFSGLTTNAALVRGALVDVTGNINVAAGCTSYLYSHPTNGASPELRMRNFTLATNATVSATYGWSGACKGSGSSGSGNSWWGWGDGKGYNRGGAGHGGRGGFISDSASSGLAYGDSNAPALPGSGGGSAASYGPDSKAGNGGGLIRLISTGRVTLKNGSRLLADGSSSTGNASDRKAGGGSGGGVYIYCRQFMGETGVVITVKGGAAGYEGGGGSGGRVAIWRVSDDAPPQVTVSVDGGMGKSAGANAPAYSGTNGTVVLGWLPSPDPIIYTMAPTNVTATSATLCGYLHAAGDPAAAVSVVWGDSDGGAPTSGLWQFTNAWPAGAWATYDFPSTNVTLPASDRIYYYRFVAENSASSSWAAESEYFLGGDVTVGAAGPATEYGLVPGTITVHRASGAATAEPITVHYEIGGTAVEGEDYVLIPAGRSVTIEAGQTSAQIVVQPLADLDGGEGSETVVLSLLTGKYGIGTPSGNTVAITDMAVVSGLNTTVGAGDWNDGSRWSQWRRPAAGDAVEVRHNLQITASSEAMQSLTVSNATLTAVNWATVLRAVDIALQSNGVITCAGPFTNGAATSRVYLECTNLTVGAYGRVDVTGKGYQGGEAANGTGHGAGAGSGGNSPAGGGHGGYGGYSGGNGETFGGGMYDSASEPALPGSGGGAYQSSGTAGGGAVRIEAGDRVTVDGAIRADGVASDLRVGTGSGGSVSIACRRIGGTGGLISADGGTATYAPYEAGSGGGGRIAILNDPAAQALEPLAHVRLSAGCGARANSEANRGGIGSIHLSDARLVADGLANILNGRIESPLQLTSSDLMVTNRWLGFAAGVQATITGDVLISGSFQKLEIGGASMGSFGGVRFRFDLPGGSALTVGNNLTVTNGAQVRVFSGSTADPAQERGAQVVIGGSLMIAPNSTAYVYSHPTNGAAPEFRASNVTVATNGTINAAIRGYAAAGLGHGAAGSIPNLWGWGYENGGGYARGGAGYGGAGYALDGQGGATYGCSNAPALPGSGGGDGSSYYYDTYAGRGGGLIRLLAADRVTLRSGARLLANGGTTVVTTSSDRRAGGGAGGGIYIHTKRFRGESGVEINANGGSSQANAGGGGGGGRIAIWRQTDEDPEAATVSVDGGMGRSGGADYPANSGADGTIVWGWIPMDGTLLLLR